MMHHTSPLTLTVRRGQPLRGTATVSGDKSISHRAILLAALAVGRSTINGLLEGEDVLATAAAMRACGAAITKDGTLWHVDGVGVGGLHEPDDVLNLGNSGTSARLIAGVLASHNLTAFFTGDASLRSRPMRRVIEPLNQIGAQCLTRNGGRLPMALIGTAQPLPITYRLPVPSAQVKSAILLAGLNTAGITTVIETIPTRDHTERMLRAFGVPVEVRQETDGAHISVRGYAELTATHVDVPCDPSSAAFPVVAALITPDSHITVPNVCLNPTRIGLLQTLIEMGAAISISNQREQGGEPVGDITASTSQLHGIDVPADRAPSMIDEYPILAVASAFASGITTMRGLHELRVKESDRLAVMADGLRACGATVAVDGDDLQVTGAATIKGGTVIDSHLDHRIAMSFAVLGMASEQPVTIAGAAAIQTSFPAFTTLFNSLGATLTTV